MHLDSFNIIISDGLEYIAINLNINTQKSIHVVCAYKIHLCLVSTFLNNFQTIIQHSFEHCPIINMGDFNVDILKDNNQAKNKQKLLDFMDKFQLKSQFSENTIKAKLQLNHIWTNVLGNECKFSVIEAYWSNFHKSIYITFNYQIHFQCITKKH
jgi:endonuclease/exonuclease/phosphatase family metal-dependent hydrolase